MNTQLELFSQTIIGEISFEEIAISIIKDCVFIGSCNIYTNFEDFSRERKITVLETYYDVSTIDFTNVNLHLVHFGYSYYNGIETEKNFKSFIVFSREDAMFMKNSFDSKITKKKLLGNYGCYVFSI